MTWLELVPSFARLALRGVGVACVSALLVGCPKEPPECGRPQAAFKVLVTASGAPLPTGTTVHIEYGSGAEEYLLGDPDFSSEVMFCEIFLRDAGVPVADAATDAGDAGAGSVEIEALSCELWTGGATTVIVSASGYPQLERELTAEEDECGVMTTDVPLTLEREDAGR
jgi:hypothetical protein